MGDTSKAPVCVGRISPPAGGPDILVGWSDSWDEDLPEVMVKSLASSPSLALLSSFDPDQRLATAEAAIASLMQEEGGYVKVRPRKGDSLIKYVDIVWLGG